MNPEIDLDDIDFDEPNPKTNGSQNRTLGKFVLTQVANGFALHVMHTSQPRVGSPVLCSYVAKELSEVPELLLSHVVANRLGK